MQKSQKPANYQIYAILVIAATMIAGIWIFGFDDELFGIKPTKQDPNPQLIPKPLISKQIIEKSSQNTQINPEPTKTYTTPEQRPIAQYITSKDSNQINSLEDAKFTLDAEGTAYEGSPSLTKPAEITLNLTPIKNTKLEKFDVSDGRIIIGTTAISFDKGTAEIKGTTMSISVINDDQLDPFFTITGTLDESILSDKDSVQDISFSNQLIYFGKQDETTPHHIDVNGKLKHHSET